MGERSMTYSGSPNPDPGEVKRDEETLQRQREEKAEQDRIEEERRILEQEVPYWQRERDFEQNPPLDNLEFNLGIESKQFQGRQLIGSRFFDAVEGGVGTGIDWLRQQAQDDPDRYTDDMLRLLGGGLQNTAWAISKLPLINEIAKGEDWLAEQARGMSEHLTPFLDPRFAGWGTRIATGILADKGIGKAVKGVKYVNKAGITGLIDNLPAQPVYAMSDDIYQNVRSIRRAFDSKLTQGGKRMALNYRALMNNHIEDYARLVASDWSTDWATGLPISKGATNLTRQTSFKNLRKELLAGFMEDYGDALKNFHVFEDGKWVKKPITRSKIQLDHRMTLVQSAGIYHNVDRRSSLFRKIQNIALQRGYTPGDARANLGLVTPETHRVKTNFFNDLHGLKDGSNNMKYWNGKHRNTGRRRMDIMDDSHKGPKEEALHLEVVEDYFDQVDRGTIILEDAQAVWKAENLKGILPEQITDELMKVLVDPQYEKYTPKSLKGVIESIVHSETDNIKKLKKVLDIEEELDTLGALGEGAESILDGSIQLKPTDTPRIKGLKKELKKLRSRKLSTWFKRWKKSVDKTKGQEGLDLYGYQKIIDDLIDG